MNVAITVEDATRDILLSVSAEDAGEPQTVVLFPDEAETLGRGLIAAANRSRALWTAAGRPDTHGGN